MIILIRHATPIIDYDACRYKSACDRMNAYNSTQEVKYDEIDPLLNEIRALVHTNNHVVVFTSILPRAINTAQYIFDSSAVSTISHPIFSEFDLDILKIPIIQLSTKGWFFISRVAWLLGMKGRSSSFSDERKRAKAASKILREHHKKNTTVILVGHAFMNKFIGRQLKKKGFYLTNKKQNGSFEIQCIESINPYCLK